MNDRPTASTITDAQLDRLHRELDEARQSAAAIAAQRDRLRQRMNTLADRWDHALPVDQPYARALRAEISVAPFDPEGAMAVQEYTEHGRRLWAFRCWGTETCDGWLGLGHHTETSALLERERHVAAEHTDRAPLRDRLAAALLARIKRATVSEAHPLGPLTSLLAANEFDLADTALAALLEHLDIGDAEAWCKVCRRVWDGKHHRCESDAEQRLSKVRDLRSDLRDVTGARWIAEALDTILDGPVAADTPADKNAAAMAKYPYEDGDVTVLGPEIFADATGKVIAWKGANFVPQNRLRLAHEARRRKEGMLDGIRRALCDAGLVEDDDPYGHADLEDVIRQALRTGCPDPVECGHEAALGLAEEKLDRVRDIASTWAHGEAGPTQAAGRCLLHALGEMKDQPPAAL